MGAYMYPIVINRKPQKIRYDKVIKLNDGDLTLALLRTLVTEEETFSVFENDDYELWVTGYRMETEEETNIRVKREESYMINYNKFHSSKNKLA